MANEPKENTVDHDEGFEAMLSTPCPDCGGGLTYMELAGAAEGEIRHGGSIAHEPGCPQAAEPEAVEYVFDGDVLVHEETGRVVGGGADLPPVA